MNCLVNVVIILTFYKLTIVAGQEDNPKYELKYLDPKSGQQGYDLFYYDGTSLRDEKWRFDPLTGVPVVNHRHGYRQKDSNRLHLFSTKNNGQGFSYSGMILNPDNEKEVIANRVEVPMLFHNGHNVRQGPIQTFAGAVQTVSGVVGNVAGAVINPQAAFSSVVQKVGQQVISGLQSTGQTILSPFSGSGSGTGGFNRPLTNIIGNFLGRPGKQGQDQQIEEQTLLNRPFHPHPPLFQQIGDRPPSQHTFPFIYHPFRPPLRPTNSPQPTLSTAELPSPQPTFPTLPTLPQQPHPTLLPETITSKPEEPQPFPTLPAHPAPFPSLSPITSIPQSMQPFPTLPPQTTLPPIYDIDVRHLGDIYKSAKPNTTEPTRVLKPVIPGLPEEDEDYIDEEEGVGNRINPNAIKSLLG